MQDKQSRLTNNSLVHLQISLQTICWSLRFLQSILNRWEHKLSLRKVRRWIQLRETHKKTESHVSTRFHRCEADDIKVDNRMLFKTNLKHLNIFWMFCGNHDFGPRNNLGSHAKVARNVAYLLLVQFFLLHFHVDFKPWVQQWRWTRCQNVFILFLSSVFMITDTEGRSPRQQKSSPERGKFRSEWYLWWWGIWAQWWITELFVLFQMEQIHHNSSDVMTNYRIDTMYHKCFPYQVPSHQQTSFSEAGVVYIECQSKKSAKKGWKWKKTWKSPHCQFRNVNFNVRLSSFCL